MATTRVIAFIGPGHTSLTPDMPQEFPVLVKYVSVTSKERGGWSQRATLLNLDTCRGNGTAERPGTISGLDGLAIEAHPEESLPRCIREHCDWGNRGGLNSYTPTQLL